MDTPPSGATSTATVQFVTALAPGATNSMNVGVAATLPGVRLTGPLGLRDFRIPSFTVTAIGSPGGLTTAMTREGGLLQLLEQSIQARFTIREDRSLVVPATQRDLTPTAARAVE